MKFSKLFIKSMLFSLIFGCNFIKSAAEPEKKESTEHFTNLKDIKSNCVIQVNAKLPIMTKDIKCALKPNKNFVEKYGNVLMDKIQIILKGAAPIEDHRILTNDLEIHHGFYFRVLE